LASSRKRAGLTILSKTRINQQRSRAATITQLKADNASLAIHYLRGCIPTRQGCCGVQSQAALHTISTKPRKDKSKHLSEQLAGLLLR
jgi:hypothetical protein